MPIVTIQVIREGTITAEEKAQLIQGVCQVLFDVLNKPLESTLVVIEEVSTDNWGRGGMPTVVFRKQRSLKQV